MTPRVLCDTNILVSAFIAGGPPSRVVESAVDGRIEMALAEPVVVELRRVLTDKIGLERDRVEKVTTFLGELAIARIPAQLSPASVTGDPDDDGILACAVAGGVDILVSGDRRHLLPLGSHEGVRIVSAPALLAELAGG